MSSLAAPGRNRSWKATGFQISMRSREAAITHKGDVNVRNNDIMLEFDRQDTENAGFLN